MSRDHALPEYRLFGAESIEDLDDFCERAVTLGDRAQRIRRTEYPSNALHQPFGVDALVERFRTHQEA